jgi:hypothetical protein
MYMLGMYFIFNLLLKIYIHYMEDEWYLKLQE